MAKGNFGERLKRERELREVSQNELTTATRISPRYLEALENEQWDKLPGGVFNRGFVRSIAKYLGLDEEKLLAEYDEAHGESSLPVPQPYENKIPRPPIWIPIAFVLAALAILSALVAGGIYGWRYFAARRAARRAAASSMADPGPASASNTLAPDSAADSSAGVMLDLAVSTSAATRVRVVGDGKLLIDEGLPVGETRHFSASRQFEVTAGDSSAVLLELNGKAMPPIAAPGASGTITLSKKDLRQATSGSAQP
jgi:cytoskeletal protein RodZ